MRILAGFVLSCLCAIAFAAARDYGYKCGLKDAFNAGYLQGRKDADNWWIGVESEADQARQKLWKEEGTL